MNRILIFLIVSLISLQTYSQNKTDAMLFGDVKSAETGEHLPFVSIFVKGTSMGTMTDATGHFKLPHLPEGVNVVVAQAIGYRAQEKEVTMEKDKAGVIFFELEEDLLNLEQVVVTATRSEHFVKKVPVRTEVITAKAIESKNAYNLFQALDGVSGVRVENQCQSCNFTMIRMQGLGSEHTQVLINGQPIYSGLAGIYGLQQLGTVDIDKIEVVKGAGSALYGSGAVAGAINIVTKEPSFQPITTIDLQLGSYKTNNFYINSSMRNEKGNIGLNVFAQRYSEDAIDVTGEGLTLDEVKKKDGVSDRVKSNLTNVGFALYVNDLFFNNDKLVVRGKTVFEKREGGVIEDDYYRNPFTEGTENITTDRYEASLSYEKNIGNRSQLSFNMAYVNHGRNATNENSITSTLSFSSKIARHNFIMGLQGFYNKMDESGMYIVVDEGSSYYGESYRSVANKSARELGLFIQDEWAISGKLMLVPGVRVDHHKSFEEYRADKQIFDSNNFPKTSFNETAVNPRLAIKYEITDKITLRANAGTGFRAPYGFSEDLHLCSGSPRVWKSSDLDPERSLSFNLSADYYGKYVRLSANLFRTDLKNKIGFTDADPEISALGYDYQWKNIDDAFVQGVELSVMANLARDLDMGVDFTYNRGEYKNSREDWKGTEYESVSKYISRFPMTTGNIRLEYSPKSWAFAISGSYQGTMYIDYYNQDIDPLLGDMSKIKKTDPFMLFNARVSKKLNNFRLYAGVNNIFNYLQDERHLDDAAFIYAPIYGTMIYGGVSINLVL